MGGTTGRQLSTVTHSCLAGAGRPRDGDVGHSTLANINGAGKKNTWKPFWLPFLIVVGFLLLQWGPSPGLATC